MSISIYQRYAEAKNEIKTQKYIVEKLEKQVIGFVKQSKDEKVINEYGIFSIVVYPKYEYSGDVKALELKLKRLKEAEQRVGTAIKIPSEVLRYMSK